MAQESVAAELRQRRLLDEVLTQYLDELLDVAVARKSQLTDLSRSTELRLHFDFHALQRADYLMDPRQVYIPGGRRFRVRHTESQQADLRKYFAQYGESPEGIGQFLQRNDSHLSAVLYRTIEYADPQLDAEIVSILPSEAAPM